MSQLISRIAVKDFVDDSICSGLRNHRAGIEPALKDLTRHVACCRAHNDEIVDDNPLKGCGETTDFRMACVAYWNEKEAHPAAPFFEFGEPLAKMGSVIEKLKSRLVRIRLEAKSADTAIGLLKSVEVHLVEAESRSDERAYGSTV
jgi:hypothetical protein